ncbi:MAG TPA: class I SAM-dependent methyltransferase [Steroidobacteraceae bacterium]|nr:class I SAM-dependent methyltransferase [Steroidobacteraceae bacterium]
MLSHDDTVQQQFDPQAQAYLHSAVHARGPDLERSRTLVSGAVRAGGAAVDVGCGPGHLSFVLARCLARVVAVDPSAQMLAAVEQGARTQGLTALHTRQAAAESLPFEAGSFALASTRYSAHHWRTLEAAMQELRRVLEPAGYLLVIDVEGHEDALADTHLQAMELLRDRSHVRNRSVSQWRALLSEGGFERIVHHRWPLRLQFGPWVQRMRTAPERVEMIRALQREAPAEVQRALAFESDGSFTVHTSLYWARKAA